jgi:insulysin
VCDCELLETRVQPHYLHTGFNRGGVFSMMISFSGSVSRFGFWLCLLWIAAAGVVAPLQAHGATLVTSELDNRSYRFVELENGLRSVLVSDPEADKAAASLDVAVGHGSDPEGREGLAHFLEHMLFLGTEKYPRAGEYQEFINDHGGSHNAYTAYGNTNYFFSVRHEYLEQALDRFAQFFIAPLFNEELVKRERVIVHSEYSARSDSEGRRTWAARRQVMNPAHPMSRFAVGSLQTLADTEGSSIRQELIDFYRENYSSHLMALSVIGRESLDELEAMVRERFSRVTRSGANRFVSDESIYLEKQLPSLLRVVPLKERRELGFTFEVPGVIPFYREKPLQQIAYVLGHEGEGSLLAVLKERGWADSLSAGPGAMDARRGTMDIRISLTESGVEQVETIGEMLFRMIQLLAEQGVEEWRFTEQRVLAQMGFRYGDKPDAVRLVQTIADRLHDYPWTDVLYAPYALESFDAEKVREYIGYLRPDRVAVTLVAPGLEVDQSEKWYGTRYATEPLNDDLVERWSQPAEFPQLELPEPNPFVPARLEMVAMDELHEKPIRLMELPGLDVWHQTLTEFGAPRSEFYISFSSPRAMASAADAALTDLYTKIVEDALNTFSYPAYLAGLGYEVYPHLHGWSVRLSGFSDRQPELLEGVLRALREPQTDAGRFERIRSALLDSYRNRLKDAPSRVVVSELQRLLIESVAPVEQRIAALEQVEFDAYLEFVREFHQRGSVRVLSVGNRLAQQTLEMVDTVRQILLDTVEPVEVGRASVVRLDPSRHYQRDIESSHKDSAVGLYIQGNSDSYRERALFYLYDQMSGSGFYHELRTEQKLGYIVQSFMMPIIKVPGMMFVVQSPDAGVELTESAVLEYISSFGESMDTLDRDQLDGARDALLSKINRRDDTLSDRASRYWREIDDEEYAFDSRQRLSAALEAITIDDMKEFVDRISGESAGSLVVRAHGSGATGGPVAGLVIDRSEILDPAKFKSAHAVF